MKKTFLWIGVVVVGILMFVLMRENQTAQTKSNTEKVVIGQPSWIGAKAISHLLEVVITERVGGEVELSPGDNASIFQAMDAGKGSIDVHPDVWLPNQESFTKKYVDDNGTVELSPNSYEGKQSFCISKDFSEKYQIKSIFDLARPEIAKLMDRDGNGKGEIWVGAPGWASANVNEVKIRDYGLLPFMEPVRAEQSVMQATVGETIAKNQGYIFYCYSPHSIWSLYDIVRLEEPPYDPDKYVMVQPSDDPNWYEKSKVSSADEIRKVQIAYSKSLQERSPMIYKFLQNASLTTDQVSDLVYQISGKKRDAREVALEWMEQNTDLVDRWLGL